MKFFIFESYFLFKRPIFFRSFSRIFSPEQGVKRDSAGLEKPEERRSPAARVPCTACPGCKTRACSSCESCRALPRQRCVLRTGEYFAVQ